MLISPVMLLLVTYLQHLFFFNDSSGGVETKFFEQVFCGLVNILFTPDHQQLRLGFIVRQNRLGLDRKSVV